MTKPDTTAAAEEIRRRQANEKIRYMARRPVGEDPSTESVTVTVNGRNYRVMYDEYVEIPRFVAEVLDRAYAESAKLFKRMAELGKMSNLGDF